MHRILETMCLNVMVKKYAYVTDTGYVNAKNVKYLKNLDIYIYLKVIMI